MPAVMSTRHDYAEEVCAKRLNPLFSILFLVANKTAAEWRLGLIVEY